MRSLHTPAVLLFLLILLPGFSGCGDKEVVRTPDPAAEPRPEWVNQRPNSPAYYIGVGSCSKTAQPLDYQSIAKKNALNDLASEIRVRVQGETFLNSLEVNRQFSEEFISTISTTTDEQIEDYEIAGQWETSTEFWVFYRLNKAEYQRRKEEKKNQAIQSARDFYGKGLQAESEARIPDAVDLLFRGLFALRPYWNEVNALQTDTGTVYLDNELYASLRRVITGLRIVPGGEKISLSAENRYSTSFPADVRYKGRPVRGITVLHSFPRDRYVKPRPQLSNDQGRVWIEVSEVSSTQKAPALELSMDIEPLLPADLDRSLEQGLVRALKTDVRSVPIDLRAPSFFITSEEKMFGASQASAPLAGAFGAELVRRGMRVTHSAEETDYTIHITSNTAEGGTSQGFTVAFLEFSVTVRRVANGETVYQESRTGIKGVQLNREAAGLDAYKKARERIESEMVKSVLDAIL